MQMQPQSVLPPATQLFLDSLKAGAKLQAPNGQPTVAAQAAQSAGIIPPQQPQQPQQGGVPPVTPEAGQEGLAGILDQLKQAQQTGPSVAQNQQQAQQQQLAQQAAQMVQKQPTQNMAEGGLAGLPVDIGEFAEGGVIGYAEGDFVDASKFMGPQPEEATSQAGDFLRRIGSGVLSGMESAGEGINRFEQRGKELNALRVKRRALNPSIFEAVTPSERAEREAKVKELDAQINSFYDTPSEAPKQPQTPEKPEEAGGSNLKFQYAPNTDIAKTINVLRAEMDRITSAPEKEQLRAEIERLYSLLPAPRPDAPPPNGGLGGLTQRDARREPAPTGPSLSGIMSEVKNAGFTQPDLTEANRLYAADRKLRENRPDFGAQDIATANRIQEMAQAQDPRLLGLMQIAARPLIRGGGARTAEVTAKFEAAKANRDAAHLRLIDASKQAEYARKIGDNQALRDANAAIVAAQQDIMKSTMTLASNMYSGQSALQAAKINADSREAMDRFTAGKTGADLRAAQIDRYADDYNKLVLDLMTKQDLKAQGINTLQDYIRYRDNIVAQGVAQESKDVTPPAVQAVLSQYGG